MLKQVKDILSASGIGEVKLNNKYNLFIEKIFYDESLLIELVFQDDSINTVELEDHWFTPETILDDVIKYGKRVIKKYEEQKRQPEGCFSYHPHTVLIVLIFLKRNVIFLLTNVYTLWYNKVYPKDRITRRNKI